MKKLLLAVTVGMLAATAPIPAHADGATYIGGCGFATLNDTTPGGQLGGQDVWNGAVRLAVVPATAGVPNGSAVTASCELKVNGVSQGTVLGPVSGTGAVAAGGQIQFTAAITDVVSMCTHVDSVNGSETVCADATTTQIVPQPVIDVLNTVIDLLNSAVFSQLDPTICTVLKALAPVANLTSPVITIDPATGDTWIGGTADTDKFWDCPPYDV